MYGELLLNEMWRKYVGGNSSTKNELTETLVDLFSKLQRFRLFIVYGKKLMSCFVISAADWFSISED